MLTSTLSVAHSFTEYNLLLLPYIAMTRGAIYPPRASRHTKKCSTVVISQLRQKYAQVGLHFGSYHDNFKAPVGLHLISVKPAASSRRRRGGGGHPAGAAGGGAAVIIKIKRSLCQALDHILQFVNIPMLVGLRNPH